MGSEISPIVVFVYNRPKHTEQTIRALQKNFLASESDLFIFSDNSRSETDQHMVNETRDYLRAIKGFKQITIIERKMNLGLANSIINGVTDVVTTYGKVIVLEDDMVTSPFFLQFMNNALDTYSFDERVISVHGYIYPLKQLLPETFFLKDTGCWGWATWKRGWDLFEADGNKLLSTIKKRDLVSSFDMNGSYHFTKMLNQQVKGKNDSWAIRWQASAFLHDKLTLFPGRSLVRNIGHDSSGTHSKTTDHFFVELADTPIVMEDVPVEEHIAVRTSLEKYFRSISPGLLERVTEFCKRRVFTFT